MMRDNQSVRSVPNFHSQRNSDPYASKSTLYQQFSNNHSRLVHHPNVGYWKDKVLPEVNERYE